MGVIGKGKVAKPWEFGVKVALSVANRETFVVDCRSLPGNPCDGQTLSETLEAGGNPKRCGGQAL